jgi:hypothetical protein
MRTLLTLFALIAFAASASAQVDDKKLDELLSKGWEPFSAQYILEYYFTDKSFTQHNLSAFSFFLRKKGGIAHCVRDSLPGDSHQFGFCVIVREGQD